MKRGMVWLAACLVGGIAFAEAPAKPGLLRALVVSGASDHDWRSTTPYIVRALENSGRFDVRVTQAFTGSTVATLKSFDLLVLDYHGPRWGEATEKAVEEFVRSGKGLLSVHETSYAFSGFEVLQDNFHRTGIFEKPWTEYRNLIGAYWDTLKNAHGKRHTFEVKFRDPNHPMARGTGGSYKATDELYHGITVMPQAEIIASAYSAPEQSGTGKVQPIVWSVKYGAGRSVHTTLGHDDVARYEPGFLALIARGAEYAATGDVTIAATVPYERRDPDALRVMVVTGGHAYETAFDSLFEGQPDVNAWLYPRNVAFGGDLRKKWDVVVLYDLTLDVTEKEKQSLKDFVEAGKGVVVLHHAIADHATWPWWFEEVAGGKYFTKPDGERAMSHYKQGEELIVRAAGKHPITAGMPPMHLWEETYSNMQMSPKVTPLLETDAASSDRVVGWVSPWEKSRVVYIQLGHDRKSHQHPAYRQLVRRAVLWTGGRLK